LGWGGLGTSPKFSSGPTKTYTTKLENQQRKSLFGAVFGFFSGSHCVRLMGFIVGGFRWKSQELGKEKAEKVPRG